MEIIVPYTHLGAVEREIRIQAGEVLHHSFGRQVALEIIVTLRILDIIKERMATLSRGEARLRRLNDAQD
ncbi:MAG: DUF1949 domain-containing protein [Bacillota bacterium]